MDRVNDAQLVDVADKRMSNFDSKTLLSENEMNARLGVAENELSGFDETDIESDDFVKIQVSAQEHEYLKKRHRETTKPYLNTFERSSSGRRNRNDNRRHFIWDSHSKRV